MAAFFDMGMRYILILTLVANYNYLVCSTFKHRIYISNSTTGHDKSDCVTNSNLTCATLDFVLGIITSEQGSKLRMSTKIHVLEDQYLKENHNLIGINNFAFTGGLGSLIKCKSHRGLVILSSKDIVIENMNFLNCASTQRAQNNEAISFYAGLFFSNITNIKVSGCRITDSAGIGIALLNVGGHVMFTETHFVGNINNSRSGSKIMSGLANVGGGLIIEFSYGTEYAQSASNSLFVFYKCTFINNGCTWNAKNEPDPKEADNGNVIFGCGGGMAMTFRGNANNNTIHLEYCTFANNLADWGGGYYILFENKTYNNFVLLKNVNVESNIGILSGGGGRFFFSPCFNYTELLQLFPNYFQQDNCSYVNNSAGWGGGVSIFGSSVHNENPLTDRHLLFTNCHWLSNQAVVASALGFVSNSVTLQELFTHNFCNGLPYTMELENCVFKENNIGSSIDNHWKFIVGTGTLYVANAPIVMNNVSFTCNNGTPLVLDLSTVHILGYVNFANNSGNEGGAVALYGRSKIILGENSSLNFFSNNALLRGGAIYAYSQGPNLKAFQVRLLARSTCFFSYFDNSNLHPSNWSAQVTFWNNSAPKKSGKSIYCDTLQFCRTYGSLSEALEWKNVFNYLDRTGSEPEIMTDPVEIHTSSNDWVSFPGQLFSPNVTLHDEKRNPTNGLLKISLPSDSNVKLGKRISPYIYISEGKSSVPLSFDSKKSKANFQLTLRSVYTQVIETIVENVTTSACYGGYEFHQGQRKCVCISQTEMPYGYRRCGQDGKTIYVKVGYWAMIGKYGKLLVYPCPLDYCFCHEKVQHMSVYTNDECVLRMFTGDTKQCAENRHGRLCSSCDEGLSLVVGLNECRKCNSYIGLLWLIPILAGLTVIVLTIIYFEIDFFSGPLNSWLYTYHVIHLMPDNNKFLDPFIKFVISLTNGTFDLSTGVCVWSGMDKLQKLFLQYLMPFYCIFLLYLINKLLRNFPNLPLANRSFYRAFVSIVIISYASLIQTTLTILQLVHVDGRWYVFEQADVSFFGTAHLPYAIPALLILLFIVLPFPFVIACSSYLTTRLQCLRNFIPLFEAIHSPYRPNRSWFASYYIFCRLVFITLLVFRNIYEYTLFPFCEAVCVIILLLFVLLRPYKDENSVYFCVDACFLSLICLVICTVNAMEVNKTKVSVEFFQDLARIFVYIPFFYSLVLFVRYMYGRLEAYRQARRERYATLM